MKLVFEIENYDGGTMLTFEVDVDEYSGAKVVRTENCSYADTDTDYIFGTEGDLIRIQSDMQWE